MASIELDGSVYSENSLPFVIAEIGHNHQGDVDIALRMIKAAEQAGATAVKLQKRSNKKLFTPEFYNAPYASENAYGSTYGEHRDYLELDVDEYRACMDEAERLGLTFFATAFDLESAEFLNDLGVPLFKVASGDLSNHPLLEKLSSFGKPLIVSTGGATLEEITASVQVLTEANARFALLQCTAGYPPAPEETNLRVIETLRVAFPDTVIGYSGHDSGVIYSVVAYALGARIIEKHFTLDRTMKGTDHSFSLEPRGMRKLVDEFESIRLALGDGKKVRYDSELGPLRKMGKMIVASRQLAAGTIVTENMLDFRSPADGLPPSMSKELVGRKLRRSIDEFEPLSLEDVE